ncbi:hypothetical protein BH18ACI4_BH18ACI4_05190 [soil metagenome]
MKIEKFIRHCTLALAIVPMVIMLTVSRNYSKLGEIKLLESDAKPANRISAT